MISHLWYARRDGKLAPSQCPAVGQLIDMMNATPPGSTDELVELSDVEPPADADVGHQHDLALAVDPSDPLPPSQPASEASVRCVDAEAIPEDGGTLDSASDMEVAPADEA